MPDTFQPIIQNDGQIVSAPVYNPGPNPLDSVLGTLSQSIRQFSSDMDDRARKKAAEKQAKAEQTKVEANRYLFESLTKYQQEFNQPVEAPAPAAAPAEPGSTIDPAQRDKIATDVDGKMQELSNVQTAVRQGSLPKTAFDAAMDRALQETLATYSDVDPADLLTFVGKLGLENSVFRSFKNQADSRKAIEEGKNETFKSAVKTGMEVLGPSAATLTDEQIAQVGWEQLKVARQMETVKQELDIREKQANLTEQERKLAREEAVRNLTQNSVQSAINTLAPLIDGTRSLIDMMNQNPGSSQANEEQFTEIVGQLRNRIPVIIENYVNGFIGSTGDTAGGEALRKTLTESIKTTVLDPIESRDKDYLNLAKRMETSLGVKASQAFPFIGLMKAMGVDVKLSDLLLEQLGPAVKGRLADEIKGLVKTNIYDLRSRESAQQSLAEVIGVLKGDVTLNQLNQSPAQLASTFKTVNNVTTSLTKEIIAGNYEHGGEWVNGMATVVAAASNVSRGNSNQTLANAIGSITINGGHEAFNRMINGGHGDGEYAQAVGIGARGAVARSMEALKRKPSQYGFYNVVYNRATGKWGYKFNEQAWKTKGGVKPTFGGMPVGYTGTGGSSQGLTPPKPSAEMLYMINGLNQGSDFLVKTAKFDEGTPQASERELRDWYNEGKMPKSVAKALEEQKPKGGKESDVAKALNSFEEVLQNGDFSFKVPTIPGAGGVDVEADGAVMVTGQKGQAVKILPTATLRQKYGENPNFKRLDAAIDARGLGQYKDIILAQIGVESKFQPKASSGSSHGIMQVNSRAWDKVAMERYGKKVTQLSPEQNIDMGLWIWAKNLQSAGGDVRDAVSMYHSGRNYNHVVTNNIGDGNLLTKDYVNGILTAGGFGE